MDTMSEPTPGATASDLCTRPAAERVVAVDRYERIARLGPFRLDKEIADVIARVAGAQGGTVPRVGLAGVPSRRGMAPTIHGEEWKVSPILPSRQGDHS
jgi:hypothetical protein